MEIKDKVAVVTGGGRGIGRALCRALSTAGAAHVAVADLDLANAEAVANDIGGSAHGVDVADESQILTLIDDVTAQHGEIDLYISNAGVGELPPDLQNGASQSNGVWERCWSVNVMAHVYASRALIPQMVKRGDGYLVNVASAAGILSQIGDAAYSSTKHAAVGLAESLAISHGDDGIKVSVVCPQYVATALIGFDEDTQELTPDGIASHDSDNILSAEQAAAIIMQGMADETFMIVPHPEVIQYLQHKAGNYGQWIGGMRKLRRTISQP
ncbi:MAG: SDR family oxidoreductase [Lysobacterales bacterium]